MYIYIWLIIKHQGYLQSPHLLWRSRVTEQIVTERRVSTSGVSAERESVRCAVEAAEEKSGHGSWRVNEERPRL